MIQFYFEVKHQVILTHYSKVSWLYINKPSRYKPISLNHEIQVTVTTFILRSSIKSYWLVSPKYHVYTSNSLQDIRQNHWPMKYRSQWPTFILRSSIQSYWLIIPRYHVYKSKSLQDIRQNHWTLKYRSKWPTFILKTSIKSYWLIIPRYHVYTSNSLQDIRQITEPWNISHSDRLLFWGQASSNTDSLFQGIMFIHQIAFKI